MDKLYKLTQVYYNGTNDSYGDKTRYFKGESEIIYDFSLIGAGTYPIVKLIADFNDGTEQFVKNYDFLDPENIYKQEIKHTFYPSAKTDHVFYYPTFYLYFSNFTKFIYQTPFRITKESFYSKYKRLTVNSAQFIDDDDNSLFLALQSSSGDILNSKIK